MFKDIYINGLKAKPGVYAATDPAVRDEASKYAPLNKPWYFVEVNADGVGRLFKQVGRHISASASDAASLAEAGNKVVDIESFAKVKSEGVPEGQGSGSAPSIAEQLRAKLSTSKPSAAPVVEAEGEEALASDYAGLEFSELRTLAKKRGLSAGGGKDAIVARLVRADLGDEAE